MKPIVYATCLLFLAGLVPGGSAVSSCQTFELEYGLQGNGPCLYVCTPNVCTLPSTSTNSGCAGYFPSNTWPNPDVACRWNCEAEYDECTGDGYWFCALIVTGPDGTRYCYGQPIH